MQMGETQIKQEQASMANDNSISQKLEAINLLELESKARELLPRAVYDYYAGGANDELTLRENRAAYERIRFSRAC